MLRSINDVATSETAEEKMKLESNLQASSEMRASRLMIETKFWRVGGAMIPTGNHCRQT